jgi:hypothetical protein
MEVVVLAPSEHLNLDKLANKYSASLRTMLLYSTRRYPSVWGLLPDFVCGRTHESEARLPLHLHWPSSTSSNRVFNIIGLCEMAPPTIHGCWTSPMVQNLRLWEAVASVPVHDGEDGFRWKWKAHGAFLPACKSCLRAPRCYQVRRTSGTPSP